MKLSFSTLGCPDWTLDEIVQRAKEYGFDGIAFRGLNGELDLTKVAEFQPDRRAGTRAKIEQAGLEINMLLTSARMMVPEPSELADSQANARDHIDLASDLGAPFVRVFGGAIPGGLSYAAAVHRAGENLRALGEHAASRNVQVLLETHDDWIEPAFTRRALEAANHPAVRVLWDIHHPWRIAEQDIEETWEQIGPWVAAVDVKDSVEDFSARLGYRYVKVGEGQVPWSDALTLLVRNGYDGWLTFEWEKRWHPDIDEPEVAFPHFRSKLQELLSEVPRG
ncbi:hypothetical protein GCM10007989_23620 [Devosia pacifica]|uniref:Xylose isomerase-like TIM barrel domain-containing protein n=1 Tax=Devosia pacifica TaxID=1335967 RepID=A0A918S6Z2_9HYPH|nr:sugar phosphate isomerase/epimerase family protein [Devosia pacifica]GHA27068.1 hypothetical protein GCM10007989_23620 [Devosia pacifica]